MSKGEAVTSGLAVCAIGVGMIVVGYQPLIGAAIATLGAGIALLAIICPDPLTTRTRKRLLRLAQAAVDAAAATKNDEEFHNLFYSEWRLETIALRDFVQTQYGMRARDFRMEMTLDHRDDAADFAGALRDLADRL